MMRIKTAGPETAEPGRRDSGTRAAQIQPGGRVLHEDGPEHPWLGGQDEVPARLWERWRVFDDNGDEMLNKGQVPNGAEKSGITV